MAGQARQATSMDALATMLQLFQGTQSKVSGGGFSETSQTNIDQTSIAKLLQQALESNQGLAAVTGGQRQAGLYGSSTNRLMANDLLARLTAQTAAQTASKTTTRTGSPTTTTQGGVKNTGDLAKLGIAMKLYQEAGGTAGVKKGLGSLAGLLGGAEAGAADFSQGASAFANFEPSFGGLESAAGISNTGFGALQQASGLDLVGTLLGGGDITAFAPAVSDTVSTIADVADESETVGNFLQASAVPTTGSNLSSSQVLAEATQNSSTTLSAAQGASQASSNLGAFGYEVPVDATSSVQYGSDVVGNAPAASSGGGSVLGYVGPVLNAYAASQTDGDYRQAVGGAVLNYFGYGFATPLVDAIARPLLDKAEDRGNESLGTFGSVLSDPVGILLQTGDGEDMTTGDLVQSTLDPGNLFGGNPGGSPGQLFAATVDPLGAALGGKGAFNAVADAANSVDSALSPGRVVCTELALQQKISMEKYRAVIQPSVTLKGRVLLGYHMLGIPAVRRMRKDPVFTERVLPYANAYLDQKLGKWNLTGFLIKSLGEPLCWILSFFNRDPESYKTLYPYRRIRNG